MIKKKKLNYYYFFSINPLTNECMKMARLQFS